MNNIKLSNVDFQSVLINNADRQNIKINNTYDITAGSGCDIELITEFDIEKTYEDSEVYNANAIHQLLELFVYEMTNMQEIINQNKTTYIELNLEYNPSTRAVSLNNWITSDAYQVADKVNKNGREVIAKGHLYYQGVYLETVYLQQTLYADSGFGKFKYFLGFTDDKTMAYLRLNANGSTLVGIKTFE